MNRLIVSFIFFSLSWIMFSQVTFVTDSFSDHYYGKVYVADTTEILSPGWIAIYKKGTDKELIRVEAEDLAVSYTNNSVEVNVKELPYGEQSVIMYEDFNFDGIKDFAIQDGQNSCYHGPSYQIYLAEKGQFVFSDEFTSLAQNYCGMFGVSSEDKQLYTMTKSGCCWHQFARFDVVQNKPREVYRLEEGIDFSIPQFFNTTIFEWNGKKLVETSSVRNLSVDIKDCLFSFDIPAKKKKVVLFNSDEYITYAFLNEFNEVEYFYPNDKDTASFELTTRNESDTLRFSTKDAQYIIYNTDTKVGIKVITKGKIYDMPGDVYSRESGRMFYLFDYGLVNLRGEDLRKWLPALSD
ncbi:XAC2610-related protein [Dysgonomonas alginatilytica]|nr:hypothetical protein [Dysgonomonas alginatilytica]